MSATPRWLSQWRPCITAVGALLVIQALVEHFIYGGSTICSCGYFRIWEGITWADGNSQQLIDWYTFFHIMQGLISYFVLAYFFPTMPISARFLLVVGTQFAWEVIENSPFLIRLYQEDAISRTYYGDSIVNSLSDTISVMIGFAFALRFPVFWSLALTVAIEALVIFMIHDDIILNTLNFIHQFDFIKAWQLSAMH
jgi:hypothetical protein